jgi:soluble lytic murein transglycosylase-like protein
MRLGATRPACKKLSSRPERAAFSCARFRSAARAVEGPWRDRTRTHIAVIVFAVLTLALVAAPQTRAEYLVLRSGQRLSVTGYQLQGDTYHLQLNGGTADLPASEVVAIEPEENFTSTPAPDATAAKSQFHDLILTSAARYHVDPDLITSVIAAESNFDPKAVSRRNARGLMQLLPQTATQLGVKNIFDPTENIDAGTRYLSTLLNHYHYNLTLTLAAYNAGPQSVDRYRTVPPYRETHSYINKVSRTYAQRKSPAPAKSSTNSAAKSTQLLATAQP